MKAPRNASPTPKGGRVYNVAYGKKSWLYRTETAALRRAEWARQIGQEPRVHVLTVKRTEWTRLAVSA